MSADTQVCVILLRACCAKHADITARQRTMTLRCRIDFPGCRRKENRDYPLPEPISISIT